MRIFAAYPITGHGMPTFPSFMFKYRHRLERYLLENKMDWEKFIIKEWNLDIPKFGISNREVEKQEEAKTVGKIKDVHIVFRNDQGILTTYSGKKALEILKTIDNEKTD